MEALYDMNHFEPSYHSASLVGPPHSPPESSSKASVTNNDIKSDALQYAPTEVGDDHTGRNPGWGSSEEKEPLNPAQRRRKEQNRAAYVIWNLESQKEINLLFFAGTATDELTVSSQITANAPSASEKKSTFASWNKSSMTSSKNPVTCMKPTNV